MRQFYIIILIFFSSTSLLSGQSIDELNVKLDSLNLVLEKVDLQISDLNKRKTEIHQQIVELNQKKNKLYLKNEYVDGVPATIINYDNGILRDEPNIDGNVIVEIPAGDTIILTEFYKKPYFKAMYKDHIGYISNSSINTNDKIRTIIIKSNRKLIKENGLEDLENLNKESGSYWIGMTKDEAINNLGYPDDINKTTGAWGVHEQWVYAKKDIYLYFENGKLTSIQD